VKAGDGQGDEPADVYRYYELWRRIANLVGGGPYDEPDLQDGRVYFRSDYSEKVRKWPEWAEQGYWGAWIIEPKHEGYFCVLRSLLHEREVDRSETIQVIFSRFLDAGKYIVMRVGDSIRTSRDIRLKSLFVNWEDRGLDARIRMEPASRDVVDFLKRESPTLKDGFAEEYLKKYTLDDDLGSYGFTLPDEQPRMGVLAVSLEELTAELLDGMPESITSQVALWRK
jgi:hypothetical protein